MNEELSQKQRDELINKFIEIRAFEEEIFILIEGDTFTKNEYFKCCDTLKELSLTQNSTIEEKEEITLLTNRIKSLANYKDSWMKIEEIFYEWIFRNLVVFPTLLKTTTLTQELFLQLFREAIVEWDNKNDSENKEEDLHFLNKLFKLLSNENIFLKIKEKYLKGLFSGPLLTEAAAISPKIESEYLAESLRQIVERDINETSNPNLSKEEEIRLIQFIQQVTYTDTLNAYKKYLATQEQKGYVTYLIFCEVMKDITMSKIRQHICLHKYIKKQNYPMTEEGLDDLVKSFDFLAPYSITNLYYSSHLECLNSISSLFNYCMPYFFFSKYENKKQLFSDMRIESENYVIKNGDMLFENLSFEFLEPRSKKLDLLNRKLIHTCEVYNKSQKKDNAKLAMGMVTGSFLISAFRMAKRDINLPSQFAYDFNNILTFYNQYLQDLEKYEMLLIQQYEKIFDKWFESRIKPLAKKIFKSELPVKSIYGSGWFEVSLKEDILNNKNECDEITPVTDKKYEPYLDSRAFKTYKLKK